MKPELLEVDRAGGAIFARRWSPDGAPRAAVQIALAGTFPMSKNGRWHPRLFPRIKKNADFSFWKTKLVLFCFRGVGATKELGARGRFSKRTLQFHRALSTRISISWKSRRMETSRRQTRRLHARCDLRGSDERSPSSQNEGNFPACKALKFHKAWKFSSNWM